jgi:hypothetical protein
MIFASSQLICQAPTGPDGDKGAQGILRDTPVGRGECIPPKKIGRQNFEKSIFKYVRNIVVFMNIFQNKFDHIIEINFKI